MALQHSQEDTDNSTSEKSRFAQKLSAVGDSGPVEAQLVSENDALSKLALKSIDWRSKRYGNLPRSAERLLKAVLAIATENRPSPWLPIATVHSGKPKLCISCELHIWTAQNNSKRVRKSF
jgi:hypothetical protein